MSDTPPINALYTRDILRHTAALSRLGRLEEADGSADAVSRLCGSRIHVDVKMDDGRVSDFAQEVEACALGQCAASIVARNVIGTSEEELRSLRNVMETMLKRNGPPPEGRWQELAILEAARGYPARHGSVMLIFDALLDAVAHSHNLKD